MESKPFPYLVRFDDKESYMFIARRAYFSQKSSNQIVNEMIFPRDWRKQNEELKAKQKKLGVKDSEILSRRKKSPRRGRLRKNK